MDIFNFNRLFFAFALILPFRMDAQIKDERYYREQAPFAMPVVIEPVFPSRQFSIVDFGAVGDGHTLNTLAFSKAIEACSRAGGGKVIVPAGIWLTGPIRLQDNLNLVVEKAAIIQFTKDHSQYPMMRIEGVGPFLVTPPVYGYQLKNVAITGEGILDGAGESWRPVKREKATAPQWSKLLKSGVVNADSSVWWPSKEAMGGDAYLKKIRKLNKTLAAEDFLPARDFMRPKMVVINSCDRVLVEGVTIRNSPRFTLNPVECTNLTIRAVQVFNEEYAQNGDGIDVSGCRNVMIYKCTVSAGDDGICMKSSNVKNADGARLENVVIAGCTVYRGHGGFVIGSNTDGGVNNVFVTDCNFIGTDIGIRIKSFEGGGGLVQNVFIDKIYMSNILNEAISFNMFYENAHKKAKGVKVLDTTKIPSFKNFSISNVFCSDARTAISLKGLPQMPVQKISFDRITISAKSGYVSENVKDISFRNVKYIIPEQPKY